MGAKKDYLIIVCGFISVAGFMFHFTQIREIPGENLYNEQLGKIFLYGGIEGFIAYIIGRIGMRILKIK